MGKLRLRENNGLAQDPKAQDPQNPTARRRATPSGPGTSVLTRAFRQQLHGGGGPSHTARSFPRGACCLGPTLSITHSAKCSPSWGLSSKRRLRDKPLCPRISAFCVGRIKGGGIFSRWERWARLLGTAAGQDQHSAVRYSPVPRSLWSLESNSRAQPGRARKGRAGSHASPSRGAANGQWRLDPPLVPKGLSEFQDCRPDHGHCPKEVGHKRNSKLWAEREASHSPSPRCKRVTFKGLTWDLTEHRAGPKRRDRTNFLTH